MKKILKKIFSRFSLVGLTIIVLFLLFVALTLGAIFLPEVIIVHFFPRAEGIVSTLVTVILWIIDVIAVLHAANRDMVPETKIPWILCIVGLNIFGVAIYATFSSHRPSRKMRRIYRATGNNTAPYEQPGVSRETMHAEMGRWAAVSVALSTANPFAVPCRGTQTQYFASGEEMMPHLLEDLQRAEKFIFLEYFILERGKFWNAILEILEQKVKAGVEVRVMYDDIGCMSKIHLNYYKTLQKKGIKCVKFNPFVPVVTNVHNNRDHRKITVIDGKVGYTGGLNLADEYINETHPFGYWKDTALRLEGEGVKNLTLMFLRLYGMQKRKVEDVAPYIPETFEVFAERGYVQPYGDGPYPLYGRHLGEDVYINIINEARRYVWITTPYLIIDYRMREALVSAVKRGVEVRILTPHIPDKKLVFALTRSNYKALIEGGVHIYEYTPGFVHAKMMLADDEVAVLGTINLDYRSFLYHFENAVFMYRTLALYSIKEDMVSTFAVSKEQTLEDAKRNVVTRGLCEIAKLFAPLF